MFAAQHRWNPCLSHSQAGLKEPISVKGIDAKLNSSFEGLYWCNWEWKLFFHWGHNSCRWMLTASKRLKASLMILSVKCKGAEGVWSKFLYNNSPMRQATAESWFPSFGLSVVPLLLPCLLPRAQWSPSMLEAELWGLCWWLLRALCRVRMAGGPSSLMAKPSQGRDVGSWSWRTAALRAWSLLFLLDYEGLDFW